MAGGGEPQHDAAGEAAWEAGGERELHLIFVRRYSVGTRPWIPSPRRRMSSRSTSLTLT